MKKQFYKVGCYFIAIFLLGFVIFKLFQFNVQYKFEKKVEKMNDSMEKCKNASIYLTNLRDNLQILSKNDSTLNKDSLRQVFFNAKDSCIRLCDSAYLAIDDVVGYKKYSSIIKLNDSLRIKLDRGGK